MKGFQLGDEVGLQFRTGDIRPFSPFAVEVSFGGDGIECLSDGHSAQAGIGHDFFFRGEFITGLQLSAFDLDHDRFFQLLIERGGSIRIDLLHDMRHIKHKEQPLYEQNR